MPLNLSGVLGARPTRFTGSTRKTDNMPRLGKGLFEGLTPRKQKRKKTMIDEATVRRIKDAANVADVIGDFRELRKRGADRWECLCPFHDDRHLGSFAVSRRHNRYCCYSCGAKGDSIDFLMQAEGMTYPDALRWLGRKYGIEVEDIHFSITDEPGGGAIPRITDNVEDDPLEARDLTVDEIKALLRTTDLQWPASRSQIKNTAFGDGISFSKRQKYLEMAINARIIVETGETRKGSSLYELNPNL